MRVLRPVPLTAPAFAPFGDLVSVEGGKVRSANQGSADRADFTASLSSTRPGASRARARFWRPSGGGWVVSACYWEEVS